MKLGDEHMRQWIWSSFVPDNIWLVVYYGVKPLHEPQLTCGQLEPTSMTFAKNIWNRHIHYNDVIMSAMASQITSLTIVYSSVYQDADQRKHQSSASLGFVRGIHRSSVNSPHITGEFPAQRASNEENYSIWWRHHVSVIFRNIPQVKLMITEFTNYGLNRLFRNVYSKFYTYTSWVLYVAILS